MTDKDKDIIYFPAFKELQTAIETLKVNLSMLILERDDLVYVVGKNIETTYLLSAGHLDYKIFQLDCDIRRLKRQMQLIQAKINRQEEIKPSDIEKQLDEEFQVYQKQLQQMLSKMNMALKRSQNERLTQIEADELKDLYRRIVKKLHPDLNPNLDAVKKDLYIQTVAAYKNGDLASMRIIAILVDDPLEKLPSEGSLNHLQKEKQRLEAQVASIQEDIQRIKSEFPFTIKELVLDKAALDKHIETLKQTISQMEEVLDSYKQKINELMGANDE